jgi:hypothetical protein
MNPTGLIIQESEFNENFLTACYEVLGYSVAHKADVKGLTGISRNLACLTAFRSKESNNHQEIYDLLSVGCLILAEENDLPDILEISAMPFALTETKLRGINAAIVSGTLRKWKIAISRGCRQDVKSHVRMCYDALYLQFRSLGLDFNKTQKYLNDNTFLLE